MELLTAFFAATVGYLLGSISFARVINRFVAPEQEITGMEIDIAGTEEKMQVEAVSGTAISMKLGAKYGGLTAILDILKVTIPTLGFKIGYPGAPYFLITAAMGLVGHNWPIYHRFRGGRGLSAIYGGFLAIDWIGSLITSFAGMFLGLVIVKDVLVSYLAGLWLMIPWLWLRTHDLAHLAYVIFVNVIFVVAMIPEIRQIVALKRRGLDGDLASAMEATPMGEMIKKMANRFGLLQEKR
jgi:glycerol-3-phosphate acyltransferase PlsY